MTTYCVPRTDLETDRAFKSYVALIDKLQQERLLDASELELVKEVSCKELAEFWRLPEQPKYHTGRLSFSNTLKSDYCYQALRTILKAILRTNTTHNSRRLISAIEKGSGLTINQSTADVLRPSRRTDKEIDLIVKRIKQGLTNGLSVMFTQNHVEQIMKNVRLRDDARAWRFVYADISYNMHLYINSLAPMPRLQVDSYRVTANALYSEDKVHYVFLDKLYYAPIHIWISQLAIYQLLDAINRNQQIGEIKCNKEIQAVMSDLSRVGVKPLMKRIEGKLEWDKHIIHASRTQINELLEQQRKTKRSRITHE
ncbi:hypothetical protein QTV44_002520 [Vibrio vulnificus]|nr:hypothetical protein [Vibrio vulnificus]